MRKKKKEVGERKKKKNRGSTEWLTETRSHKQARGFSHIKYCRVAPATPHSIKSSVNRKKTSRKCECFTSIFTLCSHKQISNIPKSERTECVTRGFSWYVCTRFFLLSLVRFFLLSSERKRKEMNEKRKFKN